MHQCLHLAWSKSGFRRLYAEGGEGERLEKAESEFDREIVDGPDGHDEGDAGDEDGAGGTVAVGGIYVHGSVYRAETNSL